MATSQTALLAAGGTGGHLFPAHALASELKRRGWVVHLVSDPRATEYGVAFPGDGVHVVSSATIRGRNPLSLLRTAWGLGRGWWQSRRLISRLQPDVVVGFGGYPTVPPMLAAGFSGVDTIIHEANGVLGRANRMLMKRAAAIATSFDDTRLLDGFDGPVVKTGNPVRDSVLTVASAPYSSRLPTDPFKLLVFGGSQGARVFSEVLPAAMDVMADDLRGRIHLVQQCRPEDMATVSDRYDAIGLDAQLASFIEDMPDQIAQSHLVIGRAGASTVAELTVIGRPSILVPLPHSLDQDQLRNAQSLAAAGGTILIAQNDLSPTHLSHTLAEMIAHPDKLESLAAGAARAGVADAASRLADLAEQVAGQTKEREKS